METTIKTNYKICIQCLGCYNSSFLNFRWINILEDNLDKEIDQLKKSCICDYIKCDEIEIADYENVPSTFSLNEYEDLKDFIKALTDLGHDENDVRMIFKYLDESMGQSITDVNPKNIEFETTDNLSDWAAEFVEELMNFDNSNYYISINWDDTARNIINNEYYEHYDDVSHQYYLFPNNQ